jgi:hypothetical protein
MNWCSHDSSSGFAGRDRKGITNMLQGSLENFALDEVLGLLSSTSKTGQLSIKGDRGTGSLSFRQGRLVDGTASYAANGTGIGDVMFELLRYSEGNFTFSAEEVEPTEFDEDVMSVLEDAENRLLDWRSIEAVVPTLNHIVTPVSDLPAEEVTITRGEWSALTTIAAGCPAMVVCERLNLGEVEGSRQIKNLAERQLVIISEPSSTRPRVQASSPLVNAAANGNGSGSVSLSSTVDNRTQARPPMPPGTVHPGGNPSSAEMNDFGDGLRDASDLANSEDVNGGLLMEYLKQDS